MVVRKRALKGPSDEGSEEEEILELRQEPEARVTTDWALILSTQWLPHGRTESIILTVSTC